jgi:hypothetical protein
MNIAANNPRIIALDSLVRQLGLTREGVVSCLFFAVNAFCGERGRQAVQALRAEHEFDAKWHFVFDDFARDVGVSPTHLLDLLETGIAQFGPRFATSKRETLQ